MKQQIISVASCESRRAKLDEPNDSCTSKQTHLNINLYHIINLKNGGIASAEFSAADVIDDSECMATDRQAQTHKDRERGLEKHKHDKH